jgi:exodeoxyribonuclease VII small subunit
MTEPACTPTEDLTFGSALAELDQIVAALEGGQLELEDSLGRYERGVSLLRALQLKLADAQQKVTMLIGELESEGGADEPPAGSPDASADTSEEVPF